ncbi:hypothetical protein GCM10009740_37070 [Terrabacter terrae]|uniref:Restriction endonuclease type IV Mrr domain-containing protein n=1 Tax=Terrabacter terrae TaxID=318434 RepID=A0ABN2UNT3_9MICO
MTSYWSGKCVFCGRKANMFRASAGKQTLTRRGAARAATNLAKQRAREAAERAEAVQRYQAEQRAERERAIAARRAERERAIAAQRAERERVKAAKRAEAEARQQRINGLTWQEAERLACRWMRENGYSDARLTPPGADGGVDVVSMSAIGQVKRHAKPVGLAEMQRMDSIALRQRKKALFFSTGGFTPKAKEWARDHKIELYEMPPVRRVR